MTVWNKDQYLEMFNIMDKVNTPKQKYVQFHGFVKGIVYSDLSTSSKVKHLEDILSAFEESLKNEYKNKNNKGE